MRNLRVGRFHERKAADDRVGAPLQAFQRRDRVRFGGRLSEDLAVERDDGVDAQDRPVRPPPRTLLRLAQRVRARDLDRVAGGELPDVDVQDLEADAQLLEDGAALGRAAGEDQGVRARRLPHLVAEVDRDLALGGFA